MRNAILTICLTTAAMIALRTANADEWQGKLQSVIRQFDTNAVVTVENGAYVYRHHTQTFKIHTIYKTGVISETVHDEEGPNVDGMLLKFSLQDGPYRGAAEIPQDLRRSYWTTFINAYPVTTGKNLWIEMSYGSRADKKLMEAIKTCLTQSCRQNRARSQTFEKAQPPAGGEGKPAP